MQTLVALISNQFGANTPDVVKYIGTLATRLEEIGGSSIALRRLAYERSMAAFGPLDSITRSALDALAMQLTASSNPQAPEMALHAVEARRQVFGPEAYDTRMAELKLAIALTVTGDLPAAQTRLEDLAMRFATVTGRERIGRSLVLTSLGELRLRLGDPAGALAALDQAAALALETMGPDARNLTHFDNMRAKALLALDRPAEAEAALRAGLDRMGRIGDADPTTFQNLLIGLAQALYLQGRLDEARATAEEAFLTARQMTPLHPAAQIDILENIAQLLGELDRPEFVTEARREILRQTQAFYGPDAPETYTAMSRFGAMLMLTGDQEEAKRLMETALAELERALGPEDPATLQAAQQLTLFWKRDGRIAEAIDATERSLRHLRETEGRDAPKTLTMQVNLAGLLWDDGRTAEAHRLLEDARARLWDVPETRDLRHDLDVLLAEVLMSVGDPARALALIKAERAYLAESIARAGTDVSVMVSDDDLFVAGPQFYHNMMAAMTQQLARAAWLTAVQAGDPNAGRGADLRGEMFENVQQGAGGATADAVFQATARAAARDPELAAMLSEMEFFQKDGVRNRRGRLDRLAGGDKGLPEARQDSAQAVGVLRERIARDHPELQAILTPAPTPLARLQGAEGQAPLLGADEALVLIIPSELGKAVHERGLVWAVSREAAAWAAIPMGWNAMDAIAAGLREQLDPLAIWTATLSGKLPAQSLDLAARAPVRPGVFAAGGGAATPGAPRAFNLSGAHALHQALFGDPAIAAVLRDKPNWVLVGQGATLSLPFNALVSRPPSPGTQGAARLREAGWLGLERALLTLPSVSTFAALRERATEQMSRQRPEKTNFRRYVAFGDPVFAPDPPLSRLQGSRQEVMRIAGLPGIEPLGVALAADASEARLLEMAASGQLEAADILHFATHGLMVRRENQKNGEFALALTPAKIWEVGAEPGFVEDGFLTPSEVLGLRLSADFVILSGCDTALDLEFGYIGSSGLADAFLQAGARNVLVSHWRVQDDVAARLVVDTVARSLEGLPKAEALRQAMRAVAADTSRDRTELPNAHPSVWAPFLLVGNG